jgi:hypothetical protein
MLADAKWQMVSWRTGTKGKLKACFAAVRIRTADGPPQRIKDKGQQHLPGDEACYRRTPRFRREKILPYQSACCDRSAHFGCHHQGTLDLRASPSAAERGAWARPLRRAILARTSPPCAHDDARIRLPPIPSPQTSEAGKKENGPPPRPSLPAVRHRHRGAHRPTATAAMPTLPKTDLREHAA